jgi:para-nitrobenzyl esterase
MRLTALCLTTLGYLPAVVTAAPLPVTDLVVAAQSGQLQGAEVGPSHAFLGIPYAAAPVGKLRWAKPESVTPWQGVRRATVFASQCPARGWGSSTAVIGDEDCLYLNVYAPRGAKIRRPVAVWFHGGGFTAGASQDVDPSIFAAKADVVVVTVNYRLGALGFASLPELDAENSSHSSGNYALMDQQAALRWVQQNINAFNGDPHRVTAIGESAGAFSIWTHVASPHAQSLFQRAIVMSGPGSSLSDGMPMFQRSVEQARGPSSKLAAELGCDRGPKLLACLRAVPAAKLVTAAGAEQGWPGWTIILDGSVLPEQPRALRERGKTAKIPILSGNTENEGGFFAQFNRLRPGGGWTEEEYRKAVLPAPFGDEILAAYPALKNRSPDDSYAAAVSDQFACATNKINTIFGHLTTVYAYEFADRDAPNTMLTFPGATGGAFHTAEIPYVFQTNYPTEIHSAPPAFSTSQKALSDRMLTAWGNFIWGRQPAPDWPLFSTSGETMILRPEGDIKLDAIEFRKKHNCGFWDTTKFGDWLVNTGNLARH